MSGSRRTATPRINSLLHRLSASERGRVESGSSEVELISGTTLCDAGARVRNVYFPHDGIIALNAPEADVELASVSDEGMFGLPIEGQRAMSPMRAVVRGEGRATMIEASAFAAILGACPGLRRQIATYAHGVLCQVCQAAACHSRHPVRARLARLLLARADRLRAATYPSTQAILAAALGALRPAISGAASALQRMDLISYRRGEMTIVDRRGLIAESCGCYAINEKIYRAARA